MSDKVRELFYKAYGGEAKAALRLKIFSDKADEEGYSQMAKLFRAIARSEEIHGERNLRKLKEIKSTEENLQESFESETQVAHVVYDEFIKEAAEEGDQSAVLIFSQARDVEEIHANLYKEAMNHMMEDRETCYFICKVCGYISDGILPDNCPVCNAGKEQFIEQ